MYLDFKDFIAVLSNPSYLASMEKSEARQALNAAIRPMRHMMCLGQWTIDLECVRLEGTTMGACTVSLDHRRARIDIDPEKHEEVGELLDTLRHELLHIAHAYFLTARTAMSPFVSEKEFESVDHSFTLGEEHTVASFEGILDACGMTPERMIELGEEQLSE